MSIKLVWSWTEWTDQDVAAVWLPRLQLSRLPGKTTLYLAGEFSAFDPLRLTGLARDVLMIIWDTASAASAIVEWAEAGEDNPERIDTHLSLDALIEHLNGLFARDENYIVRVGPFTFTEQDGDMLCVEASRSDLERLFAEVRARAKSAGWRFIDVVDD